MATACPAATAWRMSRRARPIWCLPTGRLPRCSPMPRRGRSSCMREECERAGDSPSLPALFAKTSDYIVRGYGADDRIVYGTGAVVPTPAITTRSAELLARPDVAYLHMRSARNNCYQWRIERGLRQIAADRDDRSTGMVARTTCPPRAAHGGPATSGWWTRRRDGCRQANPARLIPHDGSSLCPALVGATASTTGDRLSAWTALDQTRTRAIQSARSG